MIPYGQHDITDADIAAVVSVLRSEYLTQGSAVPAFEKVVANYCGVAHSVAVNSATSALHIACMALGLGPGDSLWTSPITFVASSNCGKYCGATVDFVDIDPDTYNISVDRLAEKLEIAEKSGTLPKVVVAVHLCGQPCDMVGIHSLGQKYGFSIIEDASHAIGGNYLSIPVGNCKYSDVTVFSFHPVKIITTAEGGMAVTNNSEIAERMSILRSHGITRDENKMTHSPDGSWYYQQIELGYNYRMNDIQAALGISQMERLDDYVARRQELACRYTNVISKLPLRVQVQPKYSYSAFHLYVIRLSLDRIKKTRKQVFNELRDAGIGVNVHYIPVHTQPYYQKMGFKLGDFPEAERYYSEAISLPIYPGLGASDHDYIIQNLEKALV